ncbi:carboxyl transferase domain-containing protein [Minwuia thermotolerans]|uniref:Carbamoyl-phosphate synthase large subunit n=1 Tax=Minwuia thermotolerans TaxID=2056226 RepID=A0A2M9G2F7_9PROT|nr:carboxyl transferase domain-containing protein [Minwuia thermotolerans]PJK29907.1 carbamoyl-phosphate synthase large subunit [Minwuia thermotolerans]
MKKLLVANRGEIAVRVMQTAAEQGWATVAVHADDDAENLHVIRADEAVALGAKGVAPYLDIARIVDAAKQTGASAVHPGYGFLAENADFARACAEAGLTFIGPDADVLALFGDKGRARSLAIEHGVPVIEGTEGPTDLDEAQRFLDGLGADGAVMVKAVAGGGGRGMRVVRAGEDLASAHERCRSEAKQAFGNPDVYVERLLRPARHVEVQVLGDGQGGVTHFRERECSIQRRNQKIVEVAPAPGLDGDVREGLIEAALKLARAVNYRGLGTFEFLVDARPDAPAPGYAFIEANARIQVEHTVTEEVCDVDLVALQLGVCEGRSLADLGVAGDRPEPKGYAIQLRVNMERMTESGDVMPSGGVLQAFDPPTGRGIRVDSFGYAGYRTSPSFDSLLAKLIVHSADADYAVAVARAYRALSAFRIEGVATNIAFLQNVLKHPDVVANRVDTGFLESRMADFVRPGEHPRLYREVQAPAAGGGRRQAGAKVQNSDPLAILAFGKQEAEARAAAAEEQAPDGARPLLAPMQGTVVAMDVAEGDEVRAGQRVLIMDAMKMEHEITAEFSGVVRQLAVEATDTVYEGDPLVFIEPADVAGAAEAEQEEVDLDHIRPDLAETLERQAKTLDENRPKAVERRRKTGQRTARENVADLIDEGTWVEYGSLAVAAQRTRRSMEDLIENTPADGMLAGLGHVNGDTFPEQKSRVAVLCYDYTVMAGTQGMQNHAKKDRLLQQTLRYKLPLVVFTEGGGGRPGDVDIGQVGGLHIHTFEMFGKMSGLAPIVGINSGYCFAGNAALLGCCDVIIATENSNIGMGGPAMIEGGGLGVFSPKEVGPMSDQVPNGVVDIAVRDEAEAVATAKKYLSYFQGPVADWDCADQRLLRRIVPENRKRLYDVREVIDVVADTGSVLELRRGFGLGMVTALIRVEGRPLGVIANNPSHLSGAIDTPGSDKAARFMRLCDAYDIPIMFLVDTPGMMVGPEVEKTALVRHCSRLFVAGANLTVPFFSFVLRKSYGLGAQGMAGASFHAPLFTVAWPSGEFGGMGLEGAVKLAYRKELLAIEDPEERNRKFEEMVAASYENGKALSTASYFEIDDVIDPADTRRMIVAALKAAPPPEPRSGKKHAWIDTW